MSHAMRRHVVVFVLLLMPLLAAAESIVVVANPDSGVTTLSRNEVINIFLGSFRQLPSGLVASPVDLPPGHPVRAEFYRRLVGKSPAEISTYWARLVFSARTRPPIQAERLEDALSLVKGAATVITYLERSQVTGRLRVVFELAE